MRRLIDTAVLLAALAIIARTWLVHGLLVPVVVSSGSMAPALLGPHRHVVCHECGFSFDCDDAAENSLPSNMLATCPNCGCGENDLTGLPRLSGDRLIVNRTAFALRPPQRWEVAVFQCPDRPQMLCVKRIVGLPGETVQIRDGEIYIDGKLLRKSVVELDELALVVHDSLRSIKITGDDRWQLAGDRRLVYQHRQPVYGGYTRPILGPVLDDSSYNQNESRMLIPIDDLILRCHISSARGEKIEFRVASRHDVFTIRIAMSENHGELLRNGSPVAKFETGDWPQGQEVHLEIAVVDQQVLVAKDRRTLLSYPFEIATTETAASSHPIEILWEDGDPDIRRLTVLRDVYYTAGFGQLPRMSSPRTYPLGADEYFVLGDNSPLSEDCRTWTKASVPADFLVGKVLEKW